MLSRPQIRIEQAVVEDFATGSYLRQDYRYPFNQHRFVRSRVHALNKFRGLCQISRQWDTPTLPVGKDHEVRSRSCLLLTYANQDVSCYPSIRENWPMGACKRLRGRLTFEKRQKEISSFFC